jgi:hypothetical protein
MEVICGEVTGGEIVRVMIVFRRLKYVVGKVVKKGGKSGRKVVLGSLGGPEKGKIWLDGS